MAGKALTLSNIRYTSSEVDFSDLDRLVKFAKSSQKECLLLVSDIGETVNNLGSMMDTSLERSAVDAGTESSGTGLLVSTRLGLVSGNQVKLLSEFLSGLGGGLSELKSRSVILSEALRLGVMHTSYVHRISVKEFLSSLSALLTDSESRVPLCAHP